MVKVKYGKRELIQAVFDSKSKAIRRAKFVKGYVVIVKSNGKFYVETSLPLIRDFEQIVYRRDRRKDIEYDNRLLRS